MPIRSWLKSWLRQWTVPAPQSRRRVRSTRPISTLAAVEALEPRQLMSVNPVGAEFPVNTSTTDHPETPQIAADAAGDYVAVWFDGVGAVMGRRFAANGTPQGDQFQISQTGTATDNPSVAMNAAGAFVVTWNEFSSTQSSLAVFARQYNATGIAVGAQFQVHAETTGTQGGPSVAMDAAGDFVIAWGIGSTPIGADGAAGTGIFAQRYSAAGTATGSVINVNSAQTGTGSSPRVAMDANGDFVVAWQTLIRAPQGSSGTPNQTVANSLNSEIDAQRFSKDGTAQGTHFRVDTPNTGAAGQPDVAMDASGSFVVTWSDYLGSGPPDISGDYKVFAQRYDATGNAAGANIRVDQETDHGNLPSVAMDNAGDFVITWSDFNGPVKGQRYDANGVTHDTPFLIAPASTAQAPVSPGESSVAFGTTNNIIVTWQWSKLGQPASTQGISARQFVFSATTPPVLTIPGAENPLNYTENDPATDLLDSLVIGESGLSGTTLTGAVIQITGNYHPGQDRLAYWNTAPVQWSWDPAVGTLTLYGEASVADYVKMLHSVTYENVSDNPNTQTRTISFTITDGSKISNTVTRDLNIAAVNDPPRIADFPGQTVTSDHPFGANDAIPLPLLLITDPDTDTLTSATIRFSANYISGSDELDFVDTATIKGSWNASTGVLTLSGTDTVENYGAAIHAITYHNLNSNPTVFTKTLTVQGTDGLALSNTYTDQITFATVPVISGVESTPLAYTENSPETVVSPGITVRDANSTVAIGATIQITGNYQLGQDRLTFLNTSGVQWSWNETTGTLSLTGPAPVASYQTMLQSVMYQNVSDNPSTLARTVTFQVSDIVGASNKLTRGIAVTAVNDPPVISGIGADPLAYTAKSPAVPVTPNLQVGDADNDQLAGATITISAGYVQGQDILSFTNTSKITGTFNAVIGVLTLTGTDSASNYRAALQSILYKNDQTPTATTSRTVSIQVTDGTTPSTAATLTIKVSA